jgi:hypothetical protein
MKYSNLNKKILINKTTIYSVPLNNHCTTTLRRDGPVLGEKRNKKEKEVPRVSEMLVECLKYWGFVKGRSRK